MAETREEMRAAQNQQARQRRLWWSLSWWGMFKSDMGFYYQLLTYLFVFMPLGFGLVLALHPDTTLAHVLLPGRGKLVVPLPALLGAGLFWFWNATAVDRAVARERAWQDALPFKVTGYEECLGDDPDRNDDRLALVFTFGDRTPTPAQILGWLAGDDGGAWTYVEATRIATRNPGVPEPDEAHNQPLVRWFHALVAKQLLPMHAQVPLVAVELRNET
jgi:hypothetical protein